MARTTWAIHNSGGVILRAHRGSDDATPTTGTGETAVDVGDVPVPRPATHKMVGSTLTAKTSGEMDTESDTTRKAELERVIGNLDATRAEMTTRFFSTTDIDAEIAALVAEHAALP